MIIISSITVVPYLVLLTCYIHLNFGNHGIPFDPISDQLQQQNRLKMSTYCYRNTIHLFLSFSVVFLSFFHSFIIPISTAVFLSFLFITCPRNLIYRLFVVITIFLYVKLSLSTAILVFPAVYDILKIFSPQFLRCF